MVKKHKESSAAETSNRSLRGEFLRSLIFLGLVVIALLGLMQIPPY